MTSMLWTLWYKDRGAGEAQILWISWKEGCRQNWKENPEKTIRKKCCQHWHWGGMKRRRQRATAMWSGRNKKSWCCALDIQNKLWTLSHIWSRSCMFGVLAIAAVVGVVGRCFFFFFFSDRTKWRKTVLRLFCYQWNFTVRKELFIFKCVIDKISRCPNSNCWLEGAEKEGFEDVIFILFKYEWLEGT